MSLCWIAGYPRNNHALTALIHEWNNRKWDCGIVGGCFIRFENLSNVVNIVFYSSPSLSSRSVAGSPPSCAVGAGSNARLRSEHAEEAEEVRLRPGEHLTLSRSHRSQSLHPFDSCMLRVLYIRRPPLAGEGSHVFHLPLPRLSLVIRNDDSYPRCGGAIIDTARSRSHTAPVPFLPSYSLHPGPSSALLPPSRTAARPLPALPPYIAARRPAPAPLHLSWLW
jgi:hypothetical protein